MKLVITALFLIATVAMAAPSPRPVVHDEIQCCSFYDTDCSYNKVEWGLCN
jgi:hypothetical protein